MSNKLSALIIGAGRIGATFDRPGDKKVLTHAHAYSLNQHFKLFGFVDPDLSAATNATSIWGGRPYTTLEDAFREQTPDVVSIASPDSTHFDYLQKLIDLRPKFIFVEKPIVNSLSQADRLADLIKNSSIPILVNYSRRFVPELREFADQIRRGDFGRLISGVGHYGKGLIHNGSHLIDLLRHWLGEVEEFSVHSKISDFTAEDPSVFGSLRIAGVPVYLNVIDSRAYTFFEVELFFEKAKIAVSDSGFSVLLQSVVEDPNFNGYRKLGESNRIQTELGRSIEFAVQHIWENFEKGGPLFVNAITALETTKICLEMQSKQGKKNEK